MTSPPTGAPAHPRDAFFDVSALQGKIAQLSGKSSRFTLAVSGLKALLLIGSTMVLSRLIPPEEFGVVALAIPVLALATNMSQLGLAQTVSQRRQVSHQLASNLFWISALVGAFIGGVFAALGPVAARYFEDPRISAVYAALGLTVFCGTLVGPFLAVYWRQMRIREAETINVLAITISTAGAILAAALGASYWAVVLQQMLLPVANGLMLGLRMGWLPSRPRNPDLQELKDCVSFGGNLALFNVLFHLSQALGPLFAGRAFSQVQAALYYRSWNLAQLPNRLMIVPLGATFISALSRLQDDAVAFRALFTRSLSRITLVLMPIGITLCVATRDVVLVLLGPTWLELVPLFAILGLRPIIAPLTAGFRWALIAQGHSRWLARIGGLNLVAIAAALSLGVQYGPTGLVTAGLLAELAVMGGVMGVVALRHSHLRAGDLGALLLESLLYGAALAIGGGLAHHLAETAGTGLALRLLALVGGFILVFGLRLLVQKSLRLDLLRLLRRKTGHQAK